MGEWQSEASQRGAREGSAPSGGCARRASQSCLPSPCNACSARAAPEMQLPGGRGQAGGRAGGRTGAGGGLNNWWWRGETTKLTLKWGGLTQIHALREIRHDVEQRPNVFRKWKVPQNSYNNNKNTKRRTPPCSAARFEGPDQTGTCKPTPHPSHTHICTRRRPEMRTVGLGRCEHARQKLEPRNQGVLAGFQRCRSSSVRPG